MELVWLFEGVDIGVCDVACGDLWGGDVSLGMVSEGKRLRGECSKNSILSSSREHTKRVAD